MKKKFQRCFTLLLCLVMIGIGALPTYASVVQISSFSGMITASSEAVDLSDIEIKVYSAVFVDEEDENALDYYAETYAFSVYTDENGAFSFTKPTTYCSISVELASLPSGYGISQRTQFIRPQRNEITFSISSIASIDTKLSGDEIEVTLLNEDGAPILAEYTVHENSPTKLGTTSSATQIFQTYKSSLASVDAMESYTYTGTVTAPGFTAPYSETVDLSDWATDSKVDFLYAKGILTEEEQMGYYCDILSSDAYSISGECGTSMIGKLTEYVDNGKARTNLELTTNINRIVRRSDDLSKYDEMYTQSIPGTTYEFLIFYDPNSTTVDETKIAAFGAEMLNVYQYFVGEAANGGQAHFDAPTSVDDVNYYAVYIVDQDNISGTAGGSTIPVGLTNSVIQIRDTTTLGDFPQRFSHEYHHAIMRDCGVPFTIPTWEMESFVSMASLVYAGYDSTDWFDDAIRSYRGFSEYSIFSANVHDLFPYGALLYPLYIYEYIDGWSTIKAIYANYAASVATGGTIYEAISDTVGISDYGDVFSECAARNFAVDFFYETLASSNLNPDYGEVHRYAENVLDISVVPLSYQYITYWSPNSSYEFSFTLEIDGDYTGFHLNTIESVFPLEYTPEGEVPEIKAISPNVSRITFTTYSDNNISVDAVTRYTIIPVNTNISGSNLNVDITVS